MQEEERNTPEMSGENEAPKKRGRKPKTAENAEVSAKKRPGRPKKVKDESAGAETFAAETPATDASASPKRSLDEVLDTAVRENRAKGRRSSEIPRNDGPSWRDAPAPAESPAETERDEEVFVPEDSGDAFAYHSEEPQSPRAEEEDVPTSFSTTDEDLNPEPYKGRENATDDDEERIAQAREFENAADEEPSREDSRNQDTRNKWQRNDRSQNRFQNNRNQNQQNNQRQQSGGNSQNRFQNNRNQNQNQQNNQRQQSGGNSQNRFQNNRNQNQQNNQRQQSGGNSQNRFQQNSRNQQQNLQRQKKPRWMQGGSSEEETINPADLTEWNVLRSQSGIEDYLAQVYFGKLPAAQTETFEAARPVGVAETPKCENAETPESASSAESVPANTPQAETPEIAEAKAEEPDAPLPAKSVGDMNYWELMANANDSTVKKLGLQKGEVKTEESAPAPAERPAEKPSFAEPDSIEIAGFGKIVSVSGFEELYKLGIREIQQKFSDLGIEFRSGVGKSELMLDYYKHAFKSKKLVKVSGVLDVFEDGFGGAVAFDIDSYRLKRMSVYVPQFFIDKYALQRGHTVGVLAVPPREDGKENCPVAVAITSVMDGAPEDARNIVPFTDLTPYYPTRRIIMEADASSGWDNLSMRVVDLLTPVGFGQRALIVAPPRTGKTVLMQGMAKSIRRNAPKAHLIILLVDERPEEVTDFKRSVDAEVVSSTFDEDASNHVHAAEMVISRARRQVEAGRDVIILLDSITRLARAYNALMPNGGRTMSGGVEANALQKPKKFFGSARNIEGGGSLTIIGTALVETGSKMDEVIFEEFKGTGNLELHLDRSLSDKRIFPSINIEKSGTRKEELLYHPDEMSKIYALRRAMKGVPANDAMEMLVQRLKKVKTNIEFLLGLNR